MSLSRLYRSNIKDPKKKLKSEAVRLVACDVTNKQMSWLATDYHNTARKFLASAPSHCWLIKSQLIHLFGVPIRFGETWLFYDNNMVTQLICLSMTWFIFEYADAKNVTSFLMRGCRGLGEYSGSFMIIRWPVR